MKLKQGNASGFATNKEGKAEGAHAKQLLVIFDESKTIDDSMFIALQGALSGGGEDTRQDVYCLAVSTPGLGRTGWFYDLMNKPSKGWTKHKVDLEAALSAGRVSMEWVEKMKYMLGETSAQYKTRVLGEYADDADDGLIPYAWIEESVKLWNEWNTEPAAFGPLQDTALGIDIATGGNDKTVIAIRKRGYTIDVITELRKFSKVMEMETAGRVAAYLSTLENPFFVMDVLNAGGGVYGRLYELGYYGYAFKGSEKTDAVDALTGMGYKNKRAEMYYRIRERLRPDAEVRLAIPPDEDLIRQLVNIRVNIYAVDSAGRQALEPKAKLVERLRNSPDEADAVCLALFADNMETDYIGWSEESAPASDDAGYQWEDARGESDSWEW
jgi:hypothetical protein